MSHKNKLKELRLSKKLTQQEVANLLGITQRAYQNYERGRRTPSLKTAIELSKIFNCDIETIFLKNNTAKCSVTKPSNNIICNYHKKN